MLLTLIEDVLEEFRNTIEWNDADYYTYGNVRKSFEFFKEYGVFVLDLYDKSVKLCYNKRIFYSRRLVCSWERFKI